MQYGQRGGGGGSSDTCLSLKDFHLSLVFLSPTWAYKSISGPLA